VKTLPSSGRIIVHLFELEWFACHTFRNRRTVRMPRSEFHRLIASIRRHRLMLGNLQKPFLS
jgi:hypothetical protein